jgi:hypothetical protein
MPRKDFISSYTDNLTKVRWVDSLIKEKKYKKRFTRKSKTGRCNSSKKYNRAGAKSWIKC